MRSLLHRVLDALERCGVDARVDRRRKVRGRSSPWLFRLPTIRVGGRGPTEVVVCSLAHEMGHCLLARQGRTCGMAAYLHFRLTGLVSPAVLREERAAWREGFRWLRREGFVVTPSMQRIRRQRFAFFERKVKEQRGIKAP